MDDTKGRRCIDAGCQQRKSRIAIVCNEKDAGDIGERRQVRCFRFVRGGGISEQEADRSGNYESGSDDKVEGAGCLVRRRREKPCVKCQRSLHVLLDFVTTIAMFAMMGVTPRTSAVTHRYVPLLCQYGTGMTLLTGHQSGPSTTKPERMQRNHAKQAKRL
jgi:hypothetical protein